MASARVPTSTLSCVGIFAGLLLMGFAGVLVVYAPVASVAESVLDVVASPRQLNVGQTAWGYATTSRPRSSWDSSDGSSLSGASSEPSKSSDGFSESSSGFNTGMLTPNLFASVSWSWILWGLALLCMMVFAFLYNERVVEPVIHTKGTLTRGFVFRDVADDFHSNICECFLDQWVCIHGLCCPIVRMAHTNAVAGILPFWQTACMYCCAEMCCLGRCLMVFWRMELKHIMNIEDNCAIDFLVTFCCPNLSICQQASAVDHEMQYEVTDCCNLDWYDEELNAMEDRGRRDGDSFDERGRSFDERGPVPTGRYGPGRPPSYDSSSYDKGPYDSARDMNPYDSRSLQMDSYAGNQDYYR